MTATETSASKGTLDLPDPDDDVGDMVVWITHGCGLEYCCDEAQEGVSICGTGGYLAARHEELCAISDKVEFEIKFQ